MIARTVLLAAAVVGLQQALPTHTAVDWVRFWQDGGAVRAVVIGDSVGLGCCAAGFEKVHLTAEGDPLGSGRLTSEGQADMSIKGWATRLRELLQSKNPNGVLVNESRDGWDTRNFLGITRKREGDPLVDVIAAVTAPPTRYDIAFISLGINDFSHGYPYALEEWHGIFHTNLREIVRRFKRADIVPVLVKGNDVDRMVTLALPGWPQYMDVIDEVAAEEQVATIDAYLAFHAAVLDAGGFPAPALMHDYLHPNQVGHDLLFAQIAIWFNRRVPRAGSPFGSMPAPVGGALHPAWR